jgi:membrane protease YdiL (CAAX protease family)
MSLISGSNCESIPSTSNCRFEEVYYEILSLTILPALSEELIFRGWYLQILKKCFTKRTSFFILSVLFTIAHKHSDFISPIIHLYLSFIWCLLNDYCKSLWPSLIGHLFHNFSMLTLLRFTPLLCRLTKFLRLLFWIVGNLIIQWYLREVEDDNIL